MNLIVPTIRTLIVRHGEQEAQVDLEYLEHNSDFEAPLTVRGFEQADKVGRFIREFFSRKEVLDEHKSLAHQRKELIKARKNFLHHTPGFAEAYPEQAKIPQPLERKPKVHMYYSPFLRTVQTGGRILFQADDVITSCKEHIALHERQFGLHEGKASSLIALPGAAKLIERAIHSDAIYFTSLLMGESVMSSEIRAKDVLHAIDNHIAYNDCNNFVIVTHSIQGRVIAKIMMTETLSSFRADEKPDNGWARYIEGRRENVRQDHGWIYRGDAPSASL